MVKYKGISLYYYGDMAVRKAKVKVDTKDTFVSAKKRLILAIDYILHIVYTYMVLKLFLLCTYF